MREEIECKLIPHQDYLQGISRLRQVEDWTTQSLLDNPWGMVQYAGVDVFYKMLLFPVGAFYQGQCVGFSAIYNISDTVVRTGGIYILPQYRGFGIGPKLYDFALSLWPKPWNRFVTYYQSNSVIKLMKHWGVLEFPEHYWRNRTFAHGGKAFHRVLLCYKAFNED